MGHLAILVAGEFWYLFGLASFNQQRSSEAHVIAHQDLVNSKEGLISVTVPL